MAGTIRTAPGGKSLSRAEPDWNHEEPGKTFAETMQDEISFCTVEAFVLPAFFVFSKILKKLSF